MAETKVTIVEAVPGKNYREEYDMKGNLLSRAEIAARVSDDVAALQATPDGDVTLLQLVSVVKALAMRVGG